MAVRVRYRCYVARFIWKLPEYYVKTMAGTLPNTVNLTRSYIKYFTFLGGWRESRKIDQINIAARQM